MGWKTSRRLETVLEEGERSQGYLFRERPSRHHRTGFVQSARGQDKCKRLFMRLRGGDGRWETTVSGVL